MRAGAAALFAEALTETLLPLLAPNGTATTSMQNERRGGQQRLAAFGLRAYVCPDTVL
jgi:hypothetical protein